jgi:cytochrome d ubiquinol oxidase subunit II
MLVGIVLRGAAFVFRTYGHRGGRETNVWAGTFAITSTITPLLLGVNVGAIASGAVGEHIVEGTVSGANATPYDALVAPWLAPFPFIVGLLALALALFAFLAAVYLTVETDDAGLREDFKHRALGAAAVVFLVSHVALAIATRAAPRLRTGLVGSEWALLLQVAVGLAALTAIVALWRRRWGLARVAAAVQASLILWGWALSQYPFVIPDSLTIQQAAAPRITLELLLAALVAGAVILVPSLVYLMRTFTQRAAGRAA